MKLLPTLVVIILTACPIVAQNTSETTVAGRVMAETGSPIAGAEITIVPWSDGIGTRSKTTTDADGRYSLTATPGNYRMFARADGFASMYRTHDVRAGGNFGWDFPMRRSARIAGRILDTNGRPQSSRVIELWSTRQEPSPAPGLEYWPTGGGEDGTTNAQGEFTLSNAAPGYYRVLVYRPVPSADRNMQQIPLEGRFIEITSGRTIDDFNIRVNPPEDFAISGRVVDGTGRPIPEVGVDSYVPHGRHWWTTTSDSGTFRIDGLDGKGTSRCRVYFNGIPGADRLKLYLDNVPVNTHDITLTVPETGSVALTVVDDRKRGVLSNYDIDVVSVFLPDSAAIWESPQVDVARLDDGRSIISRVPAGTATIEIRADYLGAQRFDVSVLPNETTTVECAMKGPAVVAGRTTLDGVPQKTTIVIGDQWLASDDFGNYQFEMYPNGPLTMWFFKSDGWHRTAIVNLESGSTVTRDVEMGGPGVVLGRVDFSDDGAFRTVRVAANPSPDGWYEFGRPSPDEQVLSYALVRNPGDAYRLEHLPVGRWYFTVGRYEPAIHRSVPVDSRVIEIRDDSPIEINIVE